MSVHHPILQTLTAICLVGASGSGSAAAAFNTDAPASSASLDVRVVIPKVMQILYNAHPAQLPPADRNTARVSVQQRLVLMSTLRRGFCLDLQIGQSSLSDWQLRLSSSPGTWLEASPSGYRLCTGHAGHFDVTLSHDFKTSKAAGPAQGWPVQVSLTTP